MRHLLPAGKVQHRGKNFPVAANGKEPRPAGIAAKRRKTEEPPHADKHAVIDALSRDPLQIEIAAPRTMRVAQKRESDAARIKSLVTGTAPPRQDSRGAEEQIEEAAPVRAETVCAPTLRTDHASSPPSCVAWPQDTRIVTFPATAGNLAVMVEVRAMNFAGSNLEWRRARPRIRRLAPYDTLCHAA